MLLGLVKTGLLESTNRQATVSEQRNPQTSSMRKTPAELPFPSLNTKGHWNFDESARYFLPSMICRTQSGAGVLVYRLWETVR
jgi:hypothetical protein